MDLQSRAVMLRRVKEDFRRLVLDQHFWITFFQYFDVCVYFVIILLAQSLVFRDELYNELSAWVWFKHFSLKSTEFFIKDISLHELIVNDFESVIIKGMSADFP